MMELHAALHAAPARFTTWDSRHHHLSAHGSVGQHTDQLDSKEKKAEVWFACQQHFQFGLGHMFLFVTAAVTLLLM